MTDKILPVVHFTAFEGAENFTVGRRAYVYAWDHPRLGQQDVSTSTIQEITERGFITHNTEYVRVYDDLPAYKQL